jgi:hypothetical protein
MRANAPHPFCLGMGCGEDPTVERLGALVSEHLRSPVDWLLPAPQYGGVESLGAFRGVRLLDICHLDSQHSLEATP